MSLSAYASSPLLTLVTSYSDFSFFSYLISYSDDISSLSRPLFNSSPQHWGYKLTVADLEAAAKKMK